MRFSPKDQKLKEESREEGPPTGFFSILLYELKLMIKAMAVLYLVTTIIAAVALASMGLSIFNAPGVALVVLIGLNLISSM